MTSEQKRRALLDLVLEVSFRREKVVLSSGKESDFYLDLRQTLMRPRGVALAGELVIEKLLAGPPVEAVGGMAVGAVPLVSAVLAAAAARDPATPLLGFFVRKEAKKHGLGRRIEGGFRQVGNALAAGGFVLGDPQVLQQQCGRRGCGAGISVLIARGRVGQGRFPEHLPETAFGAEPHGGCLNDKVFSESGLLGVGLDGGRLVAAGARPLREGAFFME